MDLSLQNSITSELRAGERVLYADRALPSHGFTTFGVWIFAIPWTAFSLFWEFAATSGLWSGKQAPNNSMLALTIVMGLFGLPFILIGFGMLLSPFWVMRKLAQRTYFLTNQRVIVFQGGSKKEIQSIPLEQTRETIRREGKNGSGDLVLSIRSTVDSDGDRVSVERKIEAVANVKAFDDAVVQALKLYSRSQR